MSWIDEFLDELDGLPGVDRRSPARTEDLRRVELEWGISLPASFGLLLSRTNGLAWKDGYGRFFGVGPEATRDLVAWNSDLGWKSRYPELWTRYLLIGENAWGDQWGFHLEELRQGDSDPPIWFLSPGTMAVGHKPLGDTFAAYVEKGVLFNARGFWDPLELEIKLRFPTLPPESLLMHAPPLLLAGPEPEAEQFSVLPAEQVMRLHADAWEAVRAWPDGAVLVSFTLEPDDEGWLRLIPVWGS